MGTSRKSAHEHRGFKIVRFERPSKNWRYGNLKFWTTDPPLHPKISDPIDRLLSRGDGTIYVQTRDEMRKVIDAHLDGNPPGVYPHCSGCKVRVASPNAS